MLLFFFYKQTTKQFQNWQYQCPEINRWHCFNLCQCASKKSLIFRMKYCCMFYVLSYLKNVVYDCWITEEGDLYHYINIGQFNFDLNNVWEPTLSTKLEHFELRLRMSQNNFYDLKNNSQGKLDVPGTTQYLRVMTKLQSVSQIWAN